ncbi:alpha 1,2-mannosyltransferase, glycosyltransferase family 15 protein [Pseudohyphozyma bogoriensis]|nr:alpha 1,2-mannosyltransferase, glycosyltransferase family 15 protein [Pseudohyphozyma bogoriensis]
MSTTRLPQARYILLGSAIVLLSLHLLLTTSSTSYVTTLSSLTSGSSSRSPVLPATFYKGSEQDLGWIPRPPEWWKAGNKSTASGKVKVGGLDEGENRVQGEEVRLMGGRVNASFVILARNTDVWGTVESIRSMEDRFNKHYHYPYTFLNDEPFSAEFILHTSSVASGPCTYGVIPASDWHGQDDGSLPSWIDEERMNKAIAEMSTKQIPYAWSVPYRKMCRYQSGWFWRHELLSRYQYYWRIEPNVKYFCDLDYDPFMLMQTQKKKYAFVVTIYKYQETIETLWATTKKFLEQNPQHLATDNLMNQEGGFFYERWGDAPVHSLAAALFLERDEIHFFQNIGYRHEPFQHCPADAADRCACNPADTFG